MLDPISFIGEISYSEKSFPLTFSVRADDSDRLQIDCDSLPLNSFLHIQEACGKPGEISKVLSLHGSSEDGEWSFHSTTIEIHGYRSLGTEFRISISALAATLITTAPTVDVSVLRFRLRGYKCTRHAPIETELGKMTAAGCATPASEDHVCGYIELKRESQTTISDWKRRADALLEFVYSGICFGRGNHCQVPVTECIHEGVLELVFYSGTSSKQGLPVIHPFDQQRFLEALVHRHESAQHFPSALWTVIGWLQSDTGFDEGRFLGAMTALESAIECVLPDEARHAVSKAEFATLRDQLLAVVDHSSLSENSRVAFKGKINALNYRSFVQKIESLVIQYRLSDEVFSKKAIRDIVQLRNDIVHRGLALGQDEVWPKFLFVRELVSRIVLNELGYRGPYESYERLFVEKQSASDLTRK